MPKPPVLKPREICRVLETMGFVLVRQRGSHMQFATQTDAARPCRIIPGRDVSPVLLRQIIKNIGVTLEEFVSSP